jgi:hypothetical protein
MEQASEPNTKRLYHTRSKGDKTCRQLTVEKLKYYPGLETLSDADAAEAINAITRLSTLLFDLVRKRDTFFDEFDATHIGK